MAANQGKKSPSSNKNNSVNVQRPKIHLSATKPGDGAKKDFWHHRFPQFLNYFTIILSLGLIVFISWDTFTDIDYLENPLFMKYQFAVCMVFLAEYFYRFFISERKIRFFICAMPFLLVCIPYTNLIEYYKLQISHELLQYICFVPIARGIIALVMVVIYVTKNFSTTVFAAYTLALLPIVYMSGLVFYVAEHQINVQVKNLWYALWWAAMNFTTVGCDINPITATGMILGLLLSFLGIVMLPLFTVYSGDVVQRYNQRIKESKY